MRAISLILASLAVALLAPAAPAHAQQDYRIELRLTGTRPEQVALFRRRLVRGLTEFVQTLPASTQRRLGLQSFPDAPDSLVTIEDARARWGSQRSTLLIIIGEVKPNGEFVRTMGEVYLGYSAAQRLVLHSADAYNRVLGQVGLGGETPAFELYQRMIGFALLLRAWELGLPEEHISVIVDRIRRIGRGGVTATSPCNDRILAAVEAAGSKALVPGQTLERTASVPALAMSCI